MFIVIDLKLRTMDIERNSDDDSITILESDLTTDVLAKLRRLKIQESVLTASLNKTNFVYNDYPIEPRQCPNEKEYSAKLKKSVIEIKNMFEDIKNATSEINDNLINIDIGEVKKDILNFDSKIKALEDFISSELLLLQREEDELTKQLNEEPKLEDKVKNKLKISTKQYNAVVPSPIRVLINSPLKCSEVQKFQEFMSKSKNRCGGWNEYNHNIFTQIWNKYYSANDVESLERIMHEINNGIVMQQLTREVFVKIPGIKLDEIVAHAKWYAEYCYLKMCQKTALDKWKDNKRKIKRRPNVKQNCASFENSNNVKLCRKQNESNKNRKTGRKGRFEGLDEFIPSHISFDTNTPSDLDMNEELFNRDFQLDLSTSYIGPVENKKSEYKSRTTFAEPTEQWMNRCNGVKEAYRNIHNNIESVDKLGIPNWRSGLNKK